jgi:hypothetical protein
MTVDDKFEMLIAALTQRQDGGISKDDLKQILQDTQTNTAKAMQKAMKPENAQHPGISVFSHPAGDQAMPKPPLPYAQLFWNHYPIHKFPETETWAEWDLLRQLQPGEFTVVRKDRSLMTVTVKGERDAAGNLQKVEVEFPVTREEKWLVPPKFVLAYQLVHAGTAEPRKLFKDAWMQWMESDES